MGQDPAFLFYSSDWLTGCADLNMEERGQYITLMCLQHQKGHLSEKIIGLGLGFPWREVSEDLRKKFEVDENGLIFNERLEQEIAKRSKFTDKQRNNGSKGGRPKSQSETQPITQNKPKNNPAENENRDININEDRKEGVGEKLSDRAEGEKKQKQTEFDFSFCPPEFAAVIHDWLDYKRTRGETYKGQKSVEAFFRSLEKLSGGSVEIATEIVLQSMSNNWAGIFALKPSQGPTVGSGSAAIRLGADERVENGRRTYGTGQVTIPMNAPPRPSSQYWWNDKLKQWNL